MDYSNFNVEDFASDENFINWVNGTDPTLEKFWTDFLEKHPEQEIKISKARTLLLNLNRSQHINIKDEQTSRIWEAIASNVTELESASRVPSTKKRRSILSAVVVLSALLIAGLASWAIFLQNEELPTEDVVLTAMQNSENVIEELNATDGILQIHLNDGSVVSLGAKSRLLYEKDFNMDSTRDVFLFGEAFFEVAENPYKPFIVHTNDVVTEVLGTSFFVKAHQDDSSVIVSVKTGRVSVYATKELNALSNHGDRGKKGLILSPNQQVFYRREEQAFDRKLVDLPSIVDSSVKKSDFVFDNTPISDVFKILQNAYGVEIIFNEDILGNCFITAPLGSEPLFEKLQIICRTIGASYEIVDAKVIINSSGC